MRTFFLQPVEDLASCLGHLAQRRSFSRVMLLPLVAVVLTWWVYVPIHELLHVLGCVLTGGSVSELQISPRYGGALFARVFPFVVSGGDYAGRLSGFDTKGSDLIYLATDFLPYVLTILIGVPLIKACARKQRPVLFGISIVVGLAPFYNLPGDYFEMGSILTTRAVTFVTGGGGPPAADSQQEGQIADDAPAPPIDSPAPGDRNPPAFASLRSDDVFKLLSDIFAHPEDLHLHSKGAIAIALVLVCVSMVVGFLVALATYTLGSALARIVFPKRTTPTNC